VNRRERRATVADLRKATTWGPWHDRSHLREGIRHLGNIEACFANNKYAVLVFTRHTEMGDVLHLAIRRADDGPITSWGDMQQIKNDLAGAERYAVEVFPPTSQLVDEANMRHLFVLPEGKALPFTIQGKWR
jgi:hypothetical protein